MKNNILSIENHKKQQVLSRWRAHYRLYDNDYLNSIYDALDVVDHYDCWSEVAGSQVRKQALIDVMDERGIGGQNE